MNDDTPAVGPPRGLLRPAPDEGTSTHERVAPPLDLAPFVEHFWAVSWDVPSPVVREVLPHPSVHAVLERGRTRVAGVPRGRFTRRLEGKGEVFGIKFRPGGFRPFHSGPVSRLTDRTASLNEIFGEGSESLEDEVLGKRTMEARVGAASAFLRERLPERDPVAEDVARLVARILVDREIRKVDDLSRTFERSPRALQRLFSEYVGVSPKWVIRRYRLHEAVDRMDAGTYVDWSSLALDLGYFDQAHFIRDFRTLVGRTPGDYERTPRAQETSGLR